MVPGARALSSDRNRWWVAVVLLFVLALPAVTPRLYAGDEVGYFAILRSFLVRPRRLLRQRVPLLLRPWHCGRLDVLRELPGTGNADRSALQLLDDRLRNPLVAVLRGGRRHDKDPAGVRVGRTGRRLFAAIPAGSYVGVCFLRIPGDLHRHRDRAPPGGRGASGRARHLARHAAPALHVRRPRVQPRLRRVRRGPLCRGLAPGARNLVTPRPDGARRRLRADGHGARAGSLSSWSARPSTTSGRSSTRPGPPTGRGSERASHGWRPAPQLP